MHEYVDVSLRGKKKQKLKQREVQAFESFVHGGVHWTSQLLADNVTHAT